MEKLELKHLAPYLPYGLRIICIDHIGNEMIKDYPTLLGIDCEKESLKVGSETWRELDGYKPILHPLLDLTKKIEIDGNKFTPLKVLLNACMKGGEQEQNMLKGISSKGLFLKTAPYWVVQLLFEWHFDVFGLIEKDLAIDTNTLETVKP